MHDAGAVSNGVAGIHQFGFFARELADVKQKEQRGETGRQHEQAINQGLAGLPVPSRFLQPTIAQVGAQHGRAYLSALL